MMDLLRKARKTLYRGRVIDLIVDDVEYPSGAASVREIAHHPGGAAVVPLSDDGMITLVRQFRYPFQQHLYEIPAGKLDPGEDPSAAAARELEEETGLLAGNIVQMTSIYTSPGFCDEIIHIFLGTDLRPSSTGPRREEGEASMSVSTVPLHEALAMVLRGDIRDAKTIIGLLLVERRLISEEGFHGRP